MDEVHGLYEYLGSIASVWYRIQSRHTPSLTYKREKHQV